MSHAYHLWAPECMHNYTPALSYSVDAQTLQCERTYLPTFKCMYSVGLAVGKSQQCQLHCTISSWYAFSLHVCWYHCFICTSPASSHSLSMRQWASFASASSNTAWSTSSSWSLEFWAASPFSWGGCTLAAASRLPWSTSLTSTGAS